MCPPAYREPTSPDDSRLADPRAQSLCSHLQPHGSSPTLAALPQELLHEVFRTVALAGPRDLCTLACVCACFLSVLGGGESDSLWAIAARSARVGRAEGLSWRRVLLEVSHVRMLLLPHTMQPPQAMQPQQPMMPMGSTGFSQPAFGQQMGFGQGYNQMPQGGMPMMMR